MIHVPTPLPDELAHGYVGRLCRLNGISPSDTATRRLASSAHTPTTRANQSSWMDGVALMANMRPESFRYLHTLLPFYAAATVGDAIRWFGDSTCSAQHRITAHRINPYGSHFCPNCIREDLAFWGVSYWRRSHQLPGVTWCLKHETPLRIHPSNNATGLLPEQVEESSDCVTAVQPPPDHTGQVIRRYGEICSTLLEQPTTISVDTLVDCLSERVNSAIQRPKGRQNGQHFSEYIRRQVDAEWLQTFFPDFSFKAENTYTLLDRTITSRRIAQRTCAYALAMASLYASCDEAFEHIASHQEKEPTNNGKGPPCATRSTWHLSETSSSTLSAVRLNKAMKAFEEGRSIQAACDEAGLARSSLEAVLRTVWKQTRQIKPVQNVTSESVPTSPRTSASSEDHRSEWPPRQA